MVVMLTARDHGLISRTSPSGLDPLHEPDAVEEVERAVDAGSPHPAAARAQPIRDLLRGQAAVLIR